MRAELFIAWRQLWHRKLLNGIAVLGVTLGVLTLIAITGIMRGFQTKFLDTVLQISPHVVMFDTSLGQPAPVVDQLLGGDRAPAWAWARPSWAWPWRSAKARTGLSSSASSCPAVTASPSFTRIRATCSLRRAFTTTRSIGSTVPVA